MHTYVPEYVHTYVITRAHTCVVYKSLHYMRSFMRAYMLTSTCACFQIFICTYIHTQLVLQRALWARCGSAGAVHSHTPSAPPPVLHCAGRDLLALRGGAAEPGAADETGVAHTLLEPGFVPRPSARRSGGSATRVAFGDFAPLDPADSGSGHAAKRKRREPGEPKRPGAEDQRRETYDGDYGELFKDCIVPDRPGFVVPVLPQYEPESDELAKDNEVGAYA